MKRPFIANLDQSPPRLTTRKLDAFTPEELNLLGMADSTPAIWLALESGMSKTLDACHELQRLGYLWPTHEHRPDAQHAKGFKITDDGRRALAVARERAAA